MKFTVVFGPFVLIGLLSLSGCSIDAQAPSVDRITCGWDTSGPGGQTALSAFLTATDAWLNTHPGQIPPTPVNKYWLGDCPTDGVTQGPPIGEGDTPHE
ncbi:MAG: hypothetical protein F2923_08045 [Actinobacteria bacterium]|uniref:Unannotated protein n=1 Tax=freshwater metagenome TaxID=449393 RepID=A0A6J7SMR0_9ZZZZ|nr:hypothetical protein [Actinomycetota bacterium]MTB28574.1 hypothetical protein [Actinomycetota bacterium]